MVHSRTAQLDETFFALSDPTRREMLGRLAGGDMTVAELAEPFDLSAPAISKHLRVLERAGLLRQERQGRVRSCRLRAEPLAEAARWVEAYRRFWESQLDLLEQYLDEVQGKDVARSSEGSPKPKAKSRSKSQSKSKSKSKSAKKSKRKGD